MRARARAAGSGRRRRAQNGLVNREVVKHGVGVYVRDQIHIDGTESFWSMLKRGCIGVYDRMSSERLRRYVGALAGRHKDRPFGTLEQRSFLEARRASGSGTRICSPDSLAAHGGF